MRYRDILFAQIDMERSKQDKKWGEQNHSPLKWLAILVEEVGEVAQAILQGNRLACYQELIQCAAVIIAWIECEERGKQSPD